MNDRELRNIIIGMGGKADGIMREDAASRLFADVIAWKSPVKCRFKSSIGTTWAYPPPAAPPLIPKHGPKDGSLKAATAFLPI